MMVVAELAHYASLPVDQITQGLANDREIEVLAKLDRAEAERAAQELNELGAIVDLRLTPSHSGVFPVFKPDADRQIGVAVGGLIDDSATPPTVGESHGALPEVEPDPEPMPMTFPSRARGPSVSLGGGPRHLAPGSDRPVVSRHTTPELLDRLPMGDSGEHAMLHGFGGPPGIGEERPVPPPRAPRPRAEPRARSTGLGPGAYEFHRDGGSRGARGGQPVATPPRAAARVRGTTPPAAATPERPRAATNPAAPRPRAAPVATPPRGAAPRTKPRRRPTPLPALGGIGGAAVAPAAPKLPQRLGPGAAAPAPEGTIELDFEAVGLSKSPQGGLVPARPTNAPHALDAPGPHLAPDPGLSPRRTRAGNTGGTGHSASGRRTDEPSVLELLLRDRVALTLLTMAGALVVSLVLALQIQRDRARDFLPPLEEELAASLNDPAAVDSGELRAPAAVEDEINDTLDAMETRFLIWWLATGIPVGLGLGRLRPS